MVGWWVVGSFESGWLVGGWSILEGGQWQSGSSDRWSVCGLSVVLWTVRAVPQRLLAQLTRRKVLVGRTCVDCLRCTFLRIERQLIR